MRKKRVFLLIGLIAAFGFLGIAALFVLSLTAGRPSDLGAHNGQLAACPQSPNCVSSQGESHDQWMAPLTYEGDPQQAFAKLASIVTALPGSTVVQSSDGYLYVEFRSTFFRFTDDVEFLLEPESARIHFRSASRVGRSDLGVNRQRMETVRRLFMDDMKNRVTDAVSTQGRILTPFSVR